MDLNYQKTSHVCFLFFLVYIVGCALSQSLMSVSGALIATVALALLIEDSWGETKTRKDKSSLSFYAFLLLYFFVQSVSAAKNDLAPEKIVDAAKTLPLWLALLFPLALLTPSTGNSFTTHFSNFLRKKQRLLLWTMLACYSIGASVSAYHVYFLRMQGSGVFGNPIYYAYGLIPALCFVAQLLSKSTYKFKNIEEKLLLVNLLVLSLGIVLSANRMALLLMPLILAIAFKSVFKKRRYLFLAASLMVIGLIALYTSHEVFHQKFLRTISGGDISIRARLEAWAYNWNLFNEHFWIGTGYEGNAIDTAKRIEFLEYWKPGYDIFAHSIYFQTLAESGLLGFISLFSALGIFLYKFWPCWPLSISLIAGLTENTFNNSKAFHPFLLYTLLSTLILICNKDTEHVRPGPILGSEGEAK